MNVDEINQVFEGLDLDASNIPPLDYDTQAIGVESSAYLERLKHYKINATEFVLLHFFIGEQIEAKKGSFRFSSEDARDLFRVEQKEYEGVIGKFSLMGFFKVNNPGEQLVSIDFEKLLEVLPLLIKKHTGLWHYKEMEALLNTQIQIQEA